MRAPVPSHVQAITQAMRDMGLRFDPSAMDLTREDLRGALLALPAFRASRPDLYYTVIDEAVIDEAWVDGVLGSGALVFAPSPDVA